MELLDKVSPPENEDWLGWATELNGKSPKELEGISTLLYLHQRVWPQASWRKKFAELKPHLAGAYERYETEALRLLEIAGKSAA